MMFKKEEKIYFLILTILLALSLLLDFFVFEKAKPNFPVIIKSNDLGINFVTAPYFVWQIPLLGIIFIILNTVLTIFLKQESKNLRKLLFSVNIVIGVLVFLISLQMYFLNR